MAERRAAVLSYAAGAAVAHGAAPLALRDALLGHVARLDCALFALATCDGERGNVDGLLEALDGQECTVHDCFVTRGDASMRTLAVGDSHAHVLQHKPALFAHVCPVPGGDSRRARVWAATHFELRHPMAKASVAESLVRAWAASGAHDERPPPPPRAALVHACGAVVVDAPLLWRLARVLACDNAGTCRHCARWCAAALSTMDRCAVGDSLALLDNTMPSDAPFVAAYAHLALDLPEASVLADRLLLLWQRNGPRATTDDPVLGVVRVPVAWTHGVVWRIAAAQSVPLIALQLPRLCLERIVYMATVDVVDQMRSKEGGDVDAEQLRVEREALYVTVVQPAVARACELVKRVCQQRAKRAAAGGTTKRRKA